MKRIIVIEDDSDLGHLLQRLLRSDNHEVTWFSNGKSFLNSNAPSADLYIVDIDLGDISGLSICEELKKWDKTKDSRVIVISAHPEIELLSRNACADDFLTKPFSKQKLFEKIQHQNSTL